MRSREEEGRNEEEMAEVTRDGWNLVSWVHEKLPHGAVFASACLLVVRVSACKMVRRRPSAQPAHYVIGVGAARPLQSI